MSSVHISTHVFVLHCISLYFCFYACLQEKFLVFFTFILFFNVFLPINNHRKNKILTEEVSHVCMRKRGEDEGGTSNLRNKGFFKKFPMAHHI